MSTRNLASVTRDEVLAAYRAALRNGDSRMLEVLGGRYDWLGAVSHGPAPAPEPQPAETRDATSVVLERPRPASQLGLRDPSEWQTGVVGVTDWWRVPWLERQVLGISGLVAVVQSGAALGFEMRGGNHANWLCLVKGETAVFAVPGCQVRYVAYEVPLQSPDIVAVP